MNNNNYLLILDAGNALIKSVRKDGSETEFVHALKPLAYTEFEQIVTRNRGIIPDGYALVNGVAYAYGAQAERHGMIERRTRAARYTKDYYGVIAAIALANSYSRGGECRLFASHAPGDVDYRDDLMEAAGGAWSVQIGKNPVDYCFSEVYTFDEPQGGLMNVVLSEDGKHYKNPTINGGSALVVDIGGRTTDLLAVKRGGEVDYSLDESANVGIIDVEVALERSIRTKYKRELQNAHELPKERIRETIANGGALSVSGETLDCVDEVKGAIDLLLGRFRNAYATRANGGIGYDTVVLTGGGSALLHEALLPILNHKRVVLADSASSIHMANVRGGLKLWRFYESQGAV